MNRHRSAPAIALFALLAAATATPALAQSVYGRFDRDPDADPIGYEAEQSATATSWELVAQGDDGFTLRAEPSEEAPLIVYRPPPRGTLTVSVHGGVRGLSQQVALLAPAGHVPLTARAQPTLYWFLDAPARGTMHLVLESVAPQRTVADIRWAAPDTAGIRPLRLGDLGIRLAPGTDYRWTLTLESDGRPHEVHAAMIRRNPDAGARTASAAALAGQGYWYDALARLSEGLGQADDTALRAQRAALLQQVGLDRAAAEDRAAVQ